MSLTKPGRTQLGDVTAASLLVNGPLQTEGNFSVTGDQSINGNLSVAGDVDVGGGLHVTESFVVDSIATVSDLRIDTPTVPASAVAVGFAGDIAWDAGYIYVCVANNTWKRAAIATWP
jgi:cytoskeletal protein CcmA (bactofilin family)